MMNNFEKLTLGVIYRRSNKWWDMDLLKSTLLSYQNVNIKYFDVTEFNDDLIPNDLDAITLLPSESDKLQKFLIKNNNVKWVHSMFAGVDKFLGIKEIFQNNSITLTNSRGAFADSLAEFGIFSMLYFNYNTPLYISAFRDKKWVRPLNTQIKNKTLTIVGYGQNGAALAKKAKLGFDMKIIGLKKNINKIEGREFIDEIYEISKINEVLPKTDFLLNFLPHTEETINFFNLEKFNLLKPNCVFINLGRGSSVAEEDLIEVLQAKSILGASLDVTQEEPLKSDSPLYNLDNIYLSCHSADNTDEYFKQAVDVFVKNLNMYLNDGNLFTIVDKIKGY